MSIRETDEGHFNVRYELRDGEVPVSGITAPG